MRLRDRRIELGKPCPHCQQMVTEEVWANEKVQKSLRARKKSINAHRTKMIEEKSRPIYRSPKFNGVLPKGAGQ